MKTIISIHNQGATLRADSREVAKFFEVAHQHLRELIEKNQSSFEALGHFQFETGDGIKRAQGGGRQESFCYLTESQVAFLLTLTRNTGRTTELKLQLIQAFQSFRAALRPVDSILLTLPQQWRKVFSDDFYRALLKLYGHEFDRAEGTHSWVGTWTNKYIYGPLWDGLPAELKAKRKARLEDGETDAGFLKLHQFLEANAKQALERHVLRVTVLLQAAQSPDHFRELFASVFCGQTQSLMQSILSRRNAA